MNSAIAFKHKHMLGDEDPLTPIKSEFINDQVKFHLSNELKIPKILPHSSSARFLFGDRGNNTFHPTNGVFRGVLPLLSSLIGSKFKLFPINW